MNSPAHPSLPSTPGRGDKNQLTALLCFAKAAPQLPGLSSSPWSTSGSSSPPDSQRRSWALWHRQLKHTGKSQHSSSSVDLGKGGPKPVPRIPQLPITLSLRLLP